MRSSNLSPDEARLRAYCAHYQSQIGSGLRSFKGGQIGGGGLPSFQGTQYQHGNGIGDVLRGIFRTLIPIFGPIAANTASTFLTSAAQSIKEGKNLKEATKSALMPTA